MRKKTEEQGKIKGMWKLKGKKRKRGKIKASREPEV
jgi:hypothetical protein